MPRSRLDYTLHAKLLEAEAMADYQDLGKLADVTTLTALQLQTLLGLADWQLGWNVHAVPLAINTEPRHGRPACVAMGTCGGFNPMLTVMANAFRVAGGILYES